MSKYYCAQAGLMRLAVLFLAIISHSSFAAPDHVRPTPEERLEAVGIDSVAAMSATLLNRDADPALRYWCALALGRTGDASTKVPLSTALQDDLAVVRTGAAAALGFLGRRDAVPILREALLGDPEADVRNAAISALAAIGDKAAVAALMEKALDSSDSPTLRVNALLAIDPEAPHEVVDLETLLDDPSHTVRAAAAVASARRNDPQAVHYLVQAALNPITDEWLRAKSVRALERLTGQDFAYVKPHGGTVGDDERSEAIHEIAVWWDANQFLYQQ